MRFHFKLANSTWHSGIKIPFSRIFCHPILARSPNRSKCFSLCSTNVPFKCSKLICKQHRGLYDMLLWSLPVAPRRWNYPKEHQFRIILINNEKTKLHSAKICWNPNAKGSSSQTHLAKPENGQLLPPGSFLAQWKWKGKKNSEVTCPFYPAYSNPDYFLSWLKDRRCTRDRSLIVGERGRWVISLAIWTNDLSS